MKHVRMDYELVGFRTKDSWECNEWKVILKYNGRRMTIPYFTGMAIDKPKLDDVLYSLLLDSTAIEYSFDEWCGEFGYDTDSRKAEKLYKECLKVSEKFHKLLGEEYEYFQQKYENY